MTTVSEVQRPLTTPIRDLPTDLARRYQAKLEGYRADFEPRGTLENDLVAEMAHLVLQLEQTRAVATALAAIRVETAAVGQGPFRDDREARLAALHLQTLAFDATADGDQLRRHYDTSERALHRTIATFLKLRKAAAIAGCNTTETERGIRRHRAGRPSSQRLVLAEPRAMAALRTRPRAQQRPSAGPGYSTIPYHRRRCRPRRRGHPRSAVIADGQAGYHHGTTAGEFASAPHHTAGSNEEDDERDPGQNTDAAFKLVLEAAVANQRKPKTASSASNWGCSSRAMVAQAKEIHRQELFEQARDDFYHRRGTQPFSRKPWHPDPRLTGELPPYRNSRIERNGRNS